MFEFELKYIKFRFEYIVNDIRIRKYMKLYMFVDNV